MSQPLDRYPSRKISFSWEKKPGVSKVVTTTTTKIHEENLPNKDHHEIFSKLPPPPIQESTTSNTTTTPRNFVHDFQNIPLPPCAFQPPYYRTSSKKSIWVQDHDDPFLAAYKECTKNQKIGGGGCDEKRKNKKKKLESKLKKGMFSIFTCKGSSSVHDNNLVRISSFPHNIERD